MPLQPTCVSVKEPLTQMVLTPGSASAARNSTSLVTTRRCAGLKSESRVDEAPVPLLEGIAEASGVPAAAKGVEVEGVESSAERRCAAVAAGRVDAPLAAVSAAAAVATAVAGEAAPRMVEAPAGPAVAEALLGVRERALRPVGASSSAAAAMSRSTGVTPAELLLGGSN